MINQDIYKLAGIAYEYYRIKHPQRNYNRGRAHRSFVQDQHIDKKIVRAVVTRAYKKQMKALK